MLRIAAAILAIAVAAASTLSPADSASIETTIIYVNAAASGANDGTSWRDAFTDLQDALAIADSGDEIWIAAGTYRPAPPDGGLEATFMLVSGVAIYGGFGGWEKSVDERDWRRHETVLTGELTPGGLRVDTVITAVSPHPNTLIDGVTITRGGYYFDNHGGIYQNGGTLTVANTRLLLNSPGININGGEMFVADSEFTANDMSGTHTGGGLRVLQSAVYVYHCVFNGNIAGGGGAMRAHNSEVILDTCTFLDNHAKFGGSAILASGLTATLHITNCLFDNNSGSPALYLQPVPELVVEDSVFTHNDGGILIWTGSQSVTFINTEFIHNSSHYAGGISIVDASSGIDVTGCVFQSNSSFQPGGGVHVNTTGTANISNSEFRSNFGDVRGGGLAATGTGLVRAINCLFEWNAAPFGGGGVLVINGAMELIGCRVIGNGNDGVKARDGTSITIVNSLINSNFSSGLRVGHGLGQPAMATIINSTITNSMFWNPSQQAAIFVQEGSNANIRNSILWNNGSGVESDQIKGSAEVSHSIIQGLLPNSQYAGPGVIGEDPQFADEDGRLSKDSPAIDAGLNELLPDDIDTDLDGNPRIVDGLGDGEKIVDMGAYEFQPPAPGLPGDLTGDGVVDELDLLILLDAWGACPECTLCPADLNSDCAVDVLDLLILLDNWG